MNDTVSAVPVFSSSFYNAYRYSSEDSNTHNKASIEPGKNVV